MKKRPIPSLRRILSVDQTALYGWLVPLIFWIYELFFAIFQGITLPVFLGIGVLATPVLWALLIGRILFIRSVFRKGELAPGKITEIRPYRIGRQPVYVYRAGGQEYRSSNMIYRGWTYPQLWEGAEVPVIYDPQHPKHALIYNLYLPRLEVAIAMLTNESLELEKRRHTIEVIERDAGSLCDYLDRGRPDEQKREEAEAKIRELDAQVEELIKELDATISQLRITNPQAVDAWIDWHLALCEECLTHKKMRDSGVRNMLLAELMQEWEKVRRGEVAFVRVNRYFLSDYNTKVDEVTGLDGRC